MTFTVAVMPLPVTTCPQPWSAAAFSVLPIYNEDQCHVTCPVISGSHEFKLRMQGSIPELRAIAIRAIITLQKSNSIIANYINFVLAYLEHFSIRILPQEQLNLLLVDKYKAAYLVGPRMIVLSEEFVRGNPKGLYDLLRHEFRHAFWNTMQLYSIGHISAHNHCFSPVSMNMQEKIKSYLLKGDQRVAQLKKDLFRESSGMLSQTEKEQLDKWRAACEESTHLYFDSMGPIEVRRELFDSLHVGAIYDFSDQPPTRLFGRVKILKKILHPTVAIIVERLDPLRRLVSITEFVPQVVTYNYPASQYEFEREAYLYGTTPEPLIKAFWLELFNYTKQLMNREMMLPVPLALGTQLQTHNAAIHYIAASNNLKISPLLEQIERAIDHPERYRTNPDALRYELEDYIQQGRNSGVNIPEANRLLAKLANKTGDGLGACRYYFRAFKRLAMFSFDDIMDCLNTLITHDKWGEAKRICQKARAQYYAQYNAMPEAWAETKEYFYQNQIAQLNAIDQQIKQRRKGMR